MTTVTKTSITIISPVASNGATGATKGAPSVNSGWVDLGSGTGGAADGGNMGLSILNGASGPSVAGSMLIQWSSDNGATVYDYAGAIAGDMSSYNSSTQAGLTTATVWIDPGIRYVRVIGYGNTINPVTFGATFSGVTRA